MLLLGVALVAVAIFIGLVGWSVVMSLLVVGGLCIVLGLVQRN